MASPCPFSPLSACCQHSSQLYIPCRASQSPSSRKIRARQSTPRNAGQLCPLPAHARDKTGGAYHQTCSLFIWYSISPDRRPPNPPHAGHTAASSLSIRPQCQPARFTAPGTSTAAEARTAAGTSGAQRIILCNPVPIVGILTIKERSLCFLIIHLE